MIERIKLLIQTQNLTASQFADKINIQRSGLSHILSGRNKASLDFVQKVLNRFPEVSPDWLLNGKGSMFRNRENNNEGKPIEKEEQTQGDSLLFNLDNENIPNKKEQKNKGDNEPSDNQLADDSKSKTVVSKKTERIIILHTDGTFRDYYPG